MESTSSGSDSDSVRELNAVQISRKRNKRTKVNHIASVTAKKRASQSGNEDFYADGDILFCRVCSKAIDHSRQGTINRHKASDVHINNKKKLVPKKQTTIIRTMNAQTTAKLENLALVSDFVRMLTAANLPLNTADKPQVRTFLKSHIRCGGAIRDVPHGRAAQLVLKTLNEYEVGFENVVAFSSDSASYMVCCFTQVLQPMFENCVQLQCLAHIMNLVIKSLLGPFEKAVEWCKTFANYFNKSGARKRRYMDFLKEIGVPQRMPPSPVPTR